MSNEKYYREVHGSEVATAGDVDELVIAAPAAGKRLCITHLSVQIYVAGTNADSIVAVEDGAGGKRIIELGGSIEGSHDFDFGDYGWPLTAATGLNITTEGSATLASVRCTAFGYIRGA